MKQEDKELLLKDLCARLPYNVLVECSISEDASMDIILQTTHINELKNNTLIIKPYLRPMSSMTDEEMEIYIEISSHLCGEIAAKTMIDWLNKNHFDYRGLIEKGLALEASGGMYEEVIGVKEPPLTTFQRTNEFEYGSSYRG